jgi:hypothetical protein
MPFQSSCCCPQDTAEEKARQSDNVAVEAAVTEDHETSEPNRIARASHEGSRGKTVSLPPSIKSAKQHLDNESLREGSKVASNRYEKGSSSESPPSKQGHSNNAGSERINIAEAENLNRPRRSPKQIWIDAYNQVKKADEKFMDEYETLLSSSELQEAILKEKGKKLKDNIKMGNRKIPGCVVYG